MFRMLFHMNLGIGISILVLYSFVASSAGEDLPCAARDTGIEGRSILCVCNATYCDTISRETPADGTFIAYTSSLAGQRFEKSYGVVNREDILIDDNDENDQNGTSTSFRGVIFRLFQNLRYQTIEGFGGSVTDAASINWRKLSDGAQQRFINTYFGQEGIEYNMIRTPIGGSDFSTHPYTLADLPWNDATLSNFSLQHEDLFYKIPMMKRCLAAATAEVKITVSTWSPPVWMKTNEHITGYGQLKREHFQTYADYHMRFLEEFDKAELRPWAMTTTNEPVNGIIPWAPFNSLGVPPHHMAQWIYNNMGPALRNSKFNQTLLFAIDDQRYLLPMWLAGMELTEPRAFDYIDGIAVHYYGNFLPYLENILTTIQQQYPNKMILATEACEGPMPWDSERVSIGSWSRAVKYAKYILEDLNNYVVGWIDWNLCLDENGGPNWANNFVDAPILVFPENDEFVKQPMYYAMGHFSKFIPRGSVRIRTSRRSLTTLPKVAFLTPRGTIVMVLQNTNETELPVRVRLDTRRSVDFVMEPNSIKTVEINPNN